MHVGSLPNEVHSILNIIYSGEKVKSSLFWVKIQKLDDIKYQTLHVAG